MINIILKNDNKAKVGIVFENSTFFSLYDIRKTIASKFSDSNYFNVSNFWLNTKVIVEMQIYL